MTELWGEAFAAAEAALRGDTAARSRASESATGLTDDRELLRRPNLGRDLARLTAMLETLGLTAEVNALLRHVISQLVLDPKPFARRTDVRNELAVVLADRGHTAAAATLLSALSFRYAGDAEGRLAASRDLANLAALKFRLGILDQAKDYAERALSRCCRSGCVGCVSNWGSRSGGRGGVGA